MYLLTPKSVVLQMKQYKKKSLDVELARRYLEPGPIVLVSSAWKGEQNIMTMGWHGMMGYDMIGCYIWDQNYSQELIKKSKECCINIPEIHLLDTAVRIGNSTGAEIDKFAEFGLTPQRARKVNAPLIKECYANFECTLLDGKMIKQYSWFIFQIVAAHVAVSPKYPRTFHYTGDGVFMLSGEHTSKRRLFSPDILQA
jgi:flavin reductase (DIM6/NTAB) family NADH-FMN oxidoreductase RutF